MTPSQLVTAIMYIVIAGALVYLAFLWALPLLLQGFLFGALVVCFLVWVIWCVLKP